jgi:hypothetical protein
MTSIDHRTSAFAAASVGVLVTLVAGCDPAVGSLADCTPAAAPAGIAEDVPPVEPAALQAWLAARGYAGYLAESHAHPPAGPHGRSVRTWMNARLAGSLATCAPSHPVGAAAVKELFTGDAVTGWAVMVKTRADAGAGSWYWYEVFGAAPDADPATAGQGDDTCTGCHDGGLDAVRTRWPLT